MANAPQEVDYTSYHQGVELKGDHKFWTIDDLPWDQLAPEKVDPDLLKIVKAASLVEYNADVYAKYLCRVFHDDPKAQERFKYWAVEEVQHGKALGVWAEAVDPQWNHEQAMAEFRRGYVPEHFTGTNDISVRGSRAGEMVARCMVETGTSSYYTSIAESTEEPVLKQIAKNIAGDEFRHYKMFYDTMKENLDADNLSRLQRARIALGRIAESEDDELSYAYYAANYAQNAANDEPYRRKKHNREYMSRAGHYYKEEPLNRAVSMIFKACGYKPHTFGYDIASKIAWWKMRANAKAFEKARKEAA